MTKISLVRLFSYRTKQCLTFEPIFSRKMSSGAVLMPPSSGLDGSTFLSNGTGSPISEKNFERPFVSYSIVQFPGKGHGFQVR